MADNQGYLYRDSQHSHVDMHDMRAVDLHGTRGVDMHEMRGVDPTRMHSGDGKPLLPSHYPPSTVPSDSVSSHESSNLLRPRNAPTSATSNIETHSPSLPPQRPPERVTRDVFEFINLNSTGDFDPNPARPDKIFVEDSAPQSSDESEAESENDIPRETEGMPGDETQPEESHLQSLLEDMEYVKDALPVILRNRDRGSNLMWQTSRRLTNLKDYVHTLAQAFHISDHGESVSNPVDLEEKEYYCITCSRLKKPPWFTVKTFRRHMMQRHHPERQFDCPYGCGASNPRKSGIQNHCKLKHGLEAPDAEIDSSTSWFPYPPQCSLCQKMVRSWPEFYDCFTQHCRDRAQELSRGSTSRRPRNGCGKIGKVRKHSTRIVSAPIHGAGDKPDSQRRPMNRMASIGDSHPPPATGHRGDKQDSNQEVGGHDSSGHDNPGPQPPRGLDFPPVPPPQEPRHDPDFGDLSNRQCTSCQHQFADCEWCFQKTENSDLCHMCPEPSMVSQFAGQGLTDQGITPGYPGYPEYHNPPLRQNTFYQSSFDTFDPNIFFGSVPQPEPGSNTQTQSYWGTRNDQMPIFRQTRGYQVEAMIGTLTPVPSSFDIDCISVSKSKMAESAETRIRRLPKMPIDEGLGSLLHELSKLTLSDKITASPRGTSFTTINCPPISGCRCPCRTAARLTEACSGHAIAPLAPGKRLEMDLRILAPGTRENSHPLRARVQIVVKLLKLRSSASKSSREKRKREEAKLAFEQTLQAAFEYVPSEQLQTDTDDSEDSDGASVVFDEATASMQSSCSDISELLSPTRSCFLNDHDALFAYDDNANFTSSSLLSSAVPTIRPSSPDNCDTNSLSDDDTDSSVSFADPSDDSNPSFETNEVSFDMDLESSLYRMSQLSGGLADGICSDPTAMDPAQVLEFFFKYILYRITAMSRSVDPRRDPRLDQ